MSLLPHLVLYGIRDSGTMSFMKIGERSFEILHIFIANVQIIFGRKFVLVSKGAYIRGLIFAGLIFGIFRYFTSFL